MTIPEALRPPPKRSWKQILAALNKKDQERVLSKLGINETASISQDWFLTARREQFPPISDWFIWLLMTGRGWGKTLTGANWIIEGHMSGELKNSGIIAATASDLRRYCIQGPSGIESVAPPWFKPDYKPGRNLVIWPNNTTTLLFTSERPERLRGPNLDGF